MKCKILDEKFPSSFFEPNPDNIYAAYTKYLEQLTDDEKNIVDETKLRLTTISRRFNENYYDLNKEGFYKLYHDIKLVCTMLIHYYNPGTRNYQIVDKFYKFASELILRECYNIGVKLITNIDIVDAIDKDVDSNNVKSDTELDKAISNDFIKISTSYKVPLPESYHIKTKDMDLFSSIIFKSPLDHRVRELPNNNFDINKIIPQTNLFEEAPRLGFMAANTSNIPDPTLPPTEMMSRFLHPNWYALPTTTWLKYGDYNSWAPSFNENGSILDATTRGVMWLKKIGYLDLISLHENKAKRSNNTTTTINNNNNNNNNNNETIEDKSNQNEALPQKENRLSDEESSNNDNNELSEKEKIETDKKQTKMDNGNMNSESNNDNEINTKSHNINLENVLAWYPSHYIDEDEIKAFQEGSQSKLVKKLLLQIQNLRRERILNKNSKPSNEETKLYFKAKRILKQIIISKQVKNLSIHNSNSFPIMQANYSGTIPVVRIHIGRKRKYNTRKN